MQYVVCGIAQKNIYEWMDRLKCGRTAFDDDE